MRRFWFFLLVIFIPGCSLLLPHFLDGTSINDSDLKDIIYINEVSADNPSEADWVELYNSNAHVADLSGFYLSDSIDSAKWDFPVGSTIAGNSYLVVVCDGTGEGANTDFKLRAGVDQVALITPDKKTVIDSLLTIAPAGTGSYGRVTDGADTWTVFANPTKGSTNQ